MHLSALSASALFLAAALPALAADPLTELPTRRAAHRSCFQRSYDAAHLKQHPRQTVRSVLLSLQRESKRPEQIVLRISFEDK